MNDFTVVLGVDAGHFDQFRLAIPNWLERKPSLAKQTFLVFYDRAGVEVCDLERAIAGAVNVLWVPWPPFGVTNGYHEHVDGTRFGETQRYKMLAGFVHAPCCIYTKYWLKIDLDSIATGQDDWIDPTWFEGDPAIVASPWGYTKPPSQICNLDYWAGGIDFSRYSNKSTGPLCIVPEVGATLVKHPRIISWVGFFNTEFTRTCAGIVRETWGPGRIPVPSQDGFHWYMAKRMGLGIVTAKMKDRGWKHCNGIQGMRSAIDEIHRTDHQPGAQHDLEKRLSGAPEGGAD